MKETKYVNYTMIFYTSYNLADLTVNIVVTKRFLFKACSRKKSCLRGKMKCWEMNQNYVAKTKILFTSDIANITDSSFIVIFV